MFDWYKLSGMLFHRKRKKEKRHWFIFRWSIRYKSTVAISLSNREKPDRSKYLSRLYGVTTRGSRGRVQRGAAWRPCKDSNLFNVFQLEFLTHSPLHVWPSQIRPFSKHASVTMNSFLRLQIINDCLLKAFRVYRFFESSKPEVVSSTKLSSRTMICFYLGKKKILILHN